MNTDIQGLVHVVDDDEAMRHSLTRLLKSVGLRVACYASGLEFLEQYRPESPECLLLDVRMPGMSGPTLYGKMREQGITPPTLLLSGYGTIQIAVTAIREGVLDFIEKPYDDQMLLDKVHAALEEDIRRREGLAELTGIKACFDSLTTRERQVMELVVNGSTNKEIAFALGIRPNTVEIHRNNMMKKMDAGSVAGLVRLWMRLHETADN